MSVTFLFFFASLILGLAGSRRNRFSDLLHETKLASNLDRMRARTQVFVKHVEVSKPVVIKREIMPQIGMNMIIVGGISGLVTDLPTPDMQAMGQEDFH